MVCFDRAKTWRVSALTSYDLNRRKEGIDITPGDAFQFQVAPEVLFAAPARLS